MDVSIGVRKLKVFEGNGGKVYRVIVGDDGRDIPAEYKPTEVIVLNGTVLLLSYTQKLPMHARKSWEAGDFPIVGIYSAKKENVKNDSELKNINWKKIWSSVIYYPLMDYPPNLWGEVLVPVSSLGKSGEEIEAYALRKKELETDFLNSISVKNTFYRNLLNALKNSGGWKELKFKSKKPVNFKYTFVEIPVGSTGGNSSSQKIYAFLLMPEGKTVVELPEFNEKYTYQAVYSVFVDEAFKKVLNYVLETVSTDEALKSEFERWLVQISGSFYFYSEDHKKAFVAGSVEATPHMGFKYLLNILSAVYLSCQGVSNGKNGSAPQESAGAEIPFSNWIYLPGGEVLVPFLDFSNLEEVTEKFNKKAAAHRIYLGLSPWMLKDNNLKRIYEKYRDDPRIIKGLEYLYKTEIEILGESLEGSIPVYRKIDSERYQRLKGIVTDVREQAEKNRGTIVLSRYFSLGEDVGDTYSLAAKCDESEGCRAVLVHDPYKIALKIREVYQSIGRMDNS